MPIPAGFQIFYAQRAPYPFVVAQMERVDASNWRHRINHLVAYSATHDEAVRLATGRGKLWTSGYDEKSVPTFLPEFTTEAERVAVVITDVGIYTVRAALPSNYSATYNQLGQIVIHGHDEAGWTLDGYVLPRLASFPIIAEEVPQ